MTQTSLKTSINDILKAVSFIPATGHFVTLYELGPNVFKQCFILFGTQNAVTRNISSDIILIESFNLNIIYFGNIISKSLLRTDILKVKMCSQ